MSEQLTKIRGAWATLPKRAQIAIIAVGVVTLLVLFLVLRASTATTWSTVADGLPAEKRGEAETVLTEAGVEFRANQAGTALEVPAASANQAASALATAGIAATGGRVDCSKQFSSNSGAMGDTSARFAVKLETCQENQAANDLERIAGVKKASVDVTVENTELFSSEQQPAKASVVLDTDGTPLPGKTVRGIQQTVGARFEGLTAANVSVIDESGSSLTDDDDSGSGSGSGESRKLNIESKYNTLVEAKLMKAIEQIVGEGNASVISNVELDLDEIERKVIQNTPSGKDGQNLVELESYEKELLKGVGETSVQGVAGTGSNSVDPDNRAVTSDPLASAAGTTGDGDYLKDNNTLNYAINKVGENIKVAPGTALRNRIGVVVDNKVDPEAAAAVKDTVSAWMGGNAQDSLSFHVAPLATAASPKASTSATPPVMTSYVKWGLLGLGLIGLAFVLRRSLTQRTAELLSPADDLLLLEPNDFTPIPIAELEAALAAHQPVQQRDERLELQRKVEEIAEAKPEDVANELRRWMHQEDTGFASQRRAG